MFYRKDSYKGLPGGIWQMADGIKTSKVFENPYNPDKPLVSWSNHFKPKIYYNYNGNIVSRDATSYQYPIKTYINPDGRNLFFKAEMPYFDKLYDSYSVPYGLTISGIRTYYKYIEYYMRTRTQSAYSGYHKVPLEFQIITDYNKKPIGYTTNNLMICTTDDAEYGSIVYRIIAKKPNNEQLIYTSPYEIEFGSHIESHENTWYYYRADIAVG